MIWPRYLYNSDLRPTVAGAILAAISVLGLGSTPATPAVKRVPEVFPTIQAAITSASDGDSILIGPGVYQENLDARSKHLSLIGIAGADVTVIDGRGLGRCLRLDNGGHVVGLTIRNGYHPDEGGGIQVNVRSSTAPFRMEECRIVDNSVGYYDHGAGGGLYIGCLVNAALIRRCLFEGNRSGYIGGAVRTCGGTVVGSTFQANYAWHSGGAIHGGGEILTDNLFVANSADNVAGGYYGNPRLMERNTFVGNRHGNFFSFGASIHVPDGGVVRNNIVVRSGGILDGGTGIYFNRNVTGWPELVSELACNDVWGSSGPDIVVRGAIDTTGTHNIFVDPGFCNEALGDYTLRDSSPCVAGGTVCDQIGAFGPGCQVTPVVGATWGQIKALFR